MIQRILLNATDDLEIEVRRDTAGKITQGIVLGQTMIQDTYIVLKLHQGELKEDPVLGPNLITFIRSAKNKVAIEKQLKIHLTRAGIDYQRVKNQINTLIS